MAQLTVTYFNRWQHQAGLDRLAKASEIDLRFLKFDMPQDEIWSVLDQSHGYQIGSTRDETPAEFQARTDFFKRCPNLLALVSNGAGFDTVDVDACTAAGVVLFNQSGGNREAVAEHTLGMMLSLSKRIVETDRAMRRDRDWHRNDFIGRDIYGKTVGIVGLGNIGTRVAELCRTLFAMRVLACDPYVEEAHFKECGAEKVSMDDLLRQSDYVTIHVPRSSETENFMSSRQFELMQPHAYFITTSRGGIHDEGALNDALRSGQIAGAGLDVWAKEPPPLDHPLLQLDNVILSPHTAGVTDDARSTVAVGAAEQWISLAHGRKPPRLINPEAWPRFQARYQERFGVAAAD